MFFAALYSRTTKPNVLPSRVHSRKLSLATAKTKPTKPREDEVAQPILTSLDKPEQRSLDTKNVSLSISKIATKRFSKAF